MGLFGVLYWLAYKTDRYFGLKGRKKLPAPVISIGNLTTGGTGKTPLAIAIASALEAKGSRPAILTRGYGGSLAGPVVVRPGMRPEDAGDEPLLLAGRLPSVPVIKCADRHAGGLFALKNLSPAPDIFIMDDGFQHWGLHRDLDMLLISADDPFGGGKLLPIGDLREPVKEVKRADLILVTKCKAVPDEIAKEIRKWNAGAPIYPAWYEPESVIEFPSRKTCPVEELKGREVAAFCGIGEPSSLEKTLLETGAVIKEFTAFQDHHRFTGGELKRISARAKNAWILTTEKDIMRLGEVPAGLVLHALRVGLALQDAFWRDFFGRVHDQVSEHP